MRSTTAPGVPLAHYRQHGAGVRLFCLDCLGHRDLPLEPVIARLKARGLGDSTTGIKAVAGFVSRPCPQCGGVRFETSPWFPTRPKGEGWTSPVASEVRE
jgi:hypothetical protein